MILPACPRLINDKQQNNKIKHSQNARQTMGLLLSMPEYFVVLGRKRDRNKYLHIFLAHIQVVA